MCIFVFNRLFFDGKIMTLNCNGRLIDVTIPKVMGILNITPDSFYDGGKYKDLNGVLRQTEKMLLEGATFIDLGAYSSRPQAAFVSEADELHRILPIVRLLVATFPNIILSIDTFRSHVAEACIHAGAAMINDISAGHLDARMLDVVAQNKVPYCMMHLRGTPQTMHHQTDYTHVIPELLYYFSEQIHRARHLGINDLLVDPGFGFAKTMAQNYEILKELDHFKILNLPLLVGVSRKSMVYKMLDTTPEEALNGTTVLHTLCVSKGAHILRVHDVKEAMEVVKLTTV